MRNWGLVFCGNFAGALTVAVFMAIILTFGFSEAPVPWAKKLGHIGEGRTLGYSAHGAAGMLTLFVRAVMCNWMVSTGVVAAMMSTTVSGKAIGMWMPVMVFSTWASNIPSSTCSCSPQASCWAATSR